MARGVEEIEGISGKKSLIVCHAPIIIIKPVQTKLKKAIMKKYILPVLLIQFCTALAQDSVSTAQIETAEKIASLHFTPVKRDSMASVLSDRIKTYNYLHAQN